MVEKSNSAFRRDLSRGFTQNATRARDSGGSRTWSNPSIAGGASLDPVCAADYAVSDSGSLAFLTGALEQRATPFRVQVAEGATYRSAVVPGLALEPDAFWRAIPAL